MVCVCLDIYDSHPFFKSLDELERDMSVKEVSWDFDILKILKRKKIVIGSTAFGMMTLGIVPSSIMTLGA
jgi:hypothetical protein